MAPKRTIVVVIAVAVGALAAGLIYVFLHNAQNTAYKNAALASAYVVAKPIPDGLSGSSAVSGGYLKQESIPTEIRPATALTGLSALQGLQANSAFSPGQVLVSGMFVSPVQAATSFAQLIPAGDVAVTVSVDQVHGVAYLPVPGNKVDLMITVSGAEDFLLQNVPILAVGQSTTSLPTGQTLSTNSTTSTNSGGSYTFAVRATDALRIALAQQTGLGIYMILVPSNNPVVVTPGPPLDQGNILDGPLVSG
jgi:Flp pilus assembly protein CpaB